MNLFGLFSSLSWDNFSNAIGDYAIIIVFVFICLALINHFMGAGPKRWLAIFGVLVGGGLALTWTRRRHRYTEKKLKEHNAAIDRLRGVVEKRDKIIEKNNQKILELQAERDKLRPEIEEEKKRIEDLNARLENQLEANRTIQLAIEEKERELISDIDNARSLPDLPSAEELIKSGGLVGKRPITAPLIRDPNGAARYNNEIVIKGFVMKGDIS